MIRDLETSSSKKVRDAGVHVANSTGCYASRGAK